MPQFSIRTLLAVVVMSSIILVVGLEYGGMVRADGGSRQAVNVFLAHPKEVRKVHWAASYFSEGTDELVLAFENNDCLNLDEYWELEFVKPRNIFGVDQQWSFTEMGFTKRRLRYCSASVGTRVFNLIS